MKKFFGCLVLFVAFALTMSSAFACEKCNGNCQCGSNCKCAQEVTTEVQKVEKKDCDCTNCCDNQCCKKRFFKFFKKKCQCK